MRRFLCLTAAFLLMIPGISSALTALSVRLYASDHFSFAVPSGWTEEDQDGLSIFRAPEGSEYAGAFLSAEEIDVSDYVPFETEDLYSGIAKGLGAEGTEIVLDGHAAWLVELTSETGCLCTVLYCRGCNVLALSVTSPESEADAVRSLLLNTVRYTAYLGG